MAREQYSDVVLDSSGNPVSGATITVRDVDAEGKQTGVTAEVFQTETGAAKANPFTTGADGYWEIWLTVGRRYDIVFSAPASARTRRVAPGYWLGAEFPVGAMMPWPVEEPAPPGFLLAEGQAVSRTTYPALFAKYGTKFGKGDGSTTFNLPNPNDKFLIGKSITRPVGTTGGAETHTLTTGQMPSHGHGVTDSGHAHGVYDPGHGHGVNDPGHGHSVWGSYVTTGSGQGGNTNARLDGSSLFYASYIGGSQTGISIQGGGTGIGIFNAYTGISIQAAGSSQAHNNMPPFLTTAFIIKY